MPELEPTDEVRSTKSEGPLSGFRVLDWSIMQAGPVAGEMLGDLGAEVIKIEQRGVGDPARAVHHVQGGASLVLPGGRCYYFETFNRNKKSITVDLAKQKGREVIYRLVAKSDVFIENFRRGVPEKLGMDYKTLSRHNPRLVYGAVTGWGMKGPDASKPAFASTAQARSGFMLNLGEANMPPISGPWGMADMVAAGYLAYGILAALVNRERTGLGQEVNTSLLGGMIWLQQGEIAYSLLSGKGDRRPIRERSANALHNRYRCADDKWIMFAMSQSERYWHDFCAALGLPGLERDPRFSDAEKRRENGEALVSIMDGVFASKTSAEWIQLLDKQNSLIYGPVNSVVDLVNDAQAIENEYITDLDHPALGHIKIVGSPVSFGRTPAGPRYAAPEFGQHTEDVLIEIGSYSWDEIGQLKEEEVI
ncbi:MAG: CoA transferase [Chloroflexi bacterium]|nr:CoA transferase [Chloroflexota bacterium]